MSLIKFITDKYRSARQDIAVLVVVFAVPFFETLGKLPLVEPDEGRYAEIPREMLERGDFITPFLNYVKYFEKPPLHYWLNALSMSLFGQNEFAARFAGTLMGLLTVILTYHLGRKLFDRRAGLLSSIIIGTSSGFLIQARFNITDMTLTCTISAALGFFILAVRGHDRQKSLYYHLSYLCAGLAVLTKGLIGIVFPLGIVFFYILFTKRWKLLTEMRLATGIPLFLLVTAPWFIAVSMINPEFPHFFFIHEHFERFTSTVHKRYQPPWFFIPVLFASMLPWSLFIPSSVRGIWRERSSESGDARLYLIIWASVIFLFFSKSQSKLIPYILPLMPAIALLIGHYFSRMMDDPRPSRRPAFIAGGVLAILGAALIAYPHLGGDPALDATMGTIGGIVVLGLATFTISAGWKKSSFGLFAGLALCALMVETIVPVAVLPEAFEARSTKKLAEQFNRTAPKDAIVASMNLEQGFSFYTRRRIILIGDRNELEFGSRQGDHSGWFIDMNRFDEFKRLWMSDKPVYLLLWEAECNIFKLVIKTPVKVVAESNRKVLITNH